MNKLMDFPPLPKPRLEIINLIDVLITLLAFFLLATVFAGGSQHLGVDLPKVSKQDQWQSQQKIELTLNKENQLFLSKHMINAQELLIYLRACSSDTAVVIRADKACRYEWVVKLLDVIKQSKITKIALEVKATD